jgi:SAM-dependent methyltransferase
VSDRCKFATQTNEPADIILSTDAFEHFADPAEALRIMGGMLKPGGQIFISFLPWLHPRGGHTFSPFPWAHMLFSEAALIRWRSDFKKDGATRFAEVDGGLNQMTIRKFKRVVQASNFEFVSFETVPIRPLRFLHNRATAEMFSAIVRCTLAAKSNPATRARRA